MSDSPQDIYARNLLSHRGYPLWTPKPNIELPESYQREGLKIGDVGVVIPEDGSFDVFFNITLPREHALHAPDGVPDNFSQVKLKREDCRISPEAECPGRILSSSNVDCVVSRVDPFAVNGMACRLTDHQFSLRHNEGAMLILPEGAERYRLAKELMFLDVVVQNAVDWYRFARERLYRNIRNDALYLVTGFHKTYSWSLASFHNTGASSARCKLVQLPDGGRILPSHSTWETVRPLEWRIGPRNSVEIPNQAVFITGFKIAINEELFHLKRVTVKAEHSGSTLASTLVGFGASFVNLFLGETPEDLQSPKVTTQHRTGSRLTVWRDPCAGEREHVTVERVPRMSQPFHPSDVINRYLLTKEPSAEVAVTHDNQWITLLEKGVLKLEDIMHEGRLEAVISREYHIVTRDGAVYLQNIKPDSSSVTIDKTYATKTPKGAPSASSPARVKSGIAGSSTMPGMCDVCNAKPKYFDGTKTYPYCSKTCATKMKDMCDYCHKQPKYNDGKTTYPFCSKTCAEQAKVVGAVGGGAAADPSKLLTNGCLLCGKAVKKGHFCSQECTSKLDKNAPLLLEVHRGHDTFKNVVDQFENSWRHSRSCPAVRRVYKVIGDPALTSRYEKYRASVEARGNFTATGRLPGNESRRWHGTTRECLLGDNGNTTLCSSTLCSLCSIIRTSYSLNLFGKKTDWGKFGAGIYTSSTSSRSNDYSSNVKPSMQKAMLLNKVVVGRGYKMTKDNAKLTAPPLGYDSVLAALRGSLDYDELVCYNQDAVRPTYLVIYDA